MDKIVVIGGGGHAKVLISVLKKTGYAIAGYTDRQDRGIILGVPYLGNDGILPELIRIHGHCQAIVGVGKIDVSGLRLSLQHEIAALGFGFPVIVSTDAIVNEAVALGEGTVVFDGVVVNSGSEIGRACILNTNSTVEHDCHLGDNVHIAPGVTLSGGVTIGANCMIGTGANVIQSVNICADCRIGAGSTVVNDITIPGTYVGNAAKKIG
ncbi:MAG: acetyltransferase [Dissulfurispiraceae bacterium]|jgi:sugar O-acyltransferase (sialic acid O-acetyltransferase NeuD family)